VYIRGLFGRTERKNVQPMAVELTPDDYEQLHNFIASRSWESAPLETVLASKADTLTGGKAAILIVDDVASPKKGDCSVGVTSQYAGAAPASEHRNGTAEQAVPGDPVNRS